MNSVPPAVPPEEMQLSEYFSLTPPRDWVATASFENLPLRLLPYGRITFQPEGVADVFFKWQIANWLEGQPEWDTFFQIVARAGRPNAEQLARLYATLLRIRLEFVADYSVIDHPGLGRSLVIDYNYTDWSYKGRVIYTMAPTGPCDVQLVSYEGVEPNFSKYLIDALMSMDSCRNLDPVMLLQKLFAAS